MSLQPQPSTAVPEETARVARAAFPKGNLYLTLRDEMAHCTVTLTWLTCIPFMIKQHSALGDWRCSVSASNGFCGLSVL